MSIERNSIDPLFDGFWRTIKKMSTIKHNSSTTHTIYSYIHLVNSGFKMSYSCRYNGTMVVRATIPTGASGYLCGRHCTATSSNNMYIKVANGTVTWNLKGTDIATHTLEEGVHDYGFVGGYAVYDNVRIDSQETPPSGIANAPFMVFGGAAVYEAASNPSYSYMSEVYIHRVDFDSYSSGNPSASEDPDLCRFYPTGTNKMYNALKLNYQQITATNGTSGSTDITGATNVTYGVQLDDLKYIFSSRYRDLMACVCEDKGQPDSRSDQGALTEDPYQITYDGITHNFAFYLSGTKYPGGTTPSGGGTRGDLMRGRTPKWDIWNDCVAFGFHVRNESGLKLKFNIFKNANGDDGPIRLEWFDGYNEDPQAIHPPKLVMNSTNAIIIFHNGENYRCAEGDIMVPHTEATGIGPEYVDDKMLIIAEQVADLDYLVALGNAIPWNVNSDDLGDEYGIVGGGASILIDGDVYATTKGNEGTIMCADKPSDAAKREQLKTDYRNGKSGALQVNYLIVSLYNMLLAATNNTKSGQLTFSMINSLGHTITLPEFVKPKDITLEGKFDTFVSPDAHDTYYNRNLWVAGKITNYTAASGNTPARMKLALTAYGQSEIESTMGYTQGTLTGKNIYLEIAQTATTHTSDTYYFTGSDLMYYLFEWQAESSGTPQVITITPNTFRAGNWLRPKGWQSFDKLLKTRKLVKEYLNNGSNTKYNAYEAAGIARFNPHDKDASAPSGEVLVMDLKPCTENGSFLEENRSLYAMVSISEFDASDGTMQGRSVAMVGGTNYVLSSTAAQGLTPSAGNKEYLVKKYIEDMGYIGPRDFYKNAVEYQVTDSSIHYNNYHAQLAVMPTELGSQSTVFNNLENANIRFDIFRSDLQYILATLAPSAQANYVASCQSYAWTCGSSLVQNSTLVFFFRRPDMLIKYGDQANAIFDGWMKAYKNTNSGPDVQDKSGWTAIESSDPYGKFRGKIRVFKKTLDGSYGSDPVVEFTYSGTETWTTQPAPYPVVKTTDRKTSSNYTCDLSYEMREEPFNSPNCEAETMTTYGYLWYYNIVIRCSSGVAAGDTYRIEYVYQ